MPPSIISKIPVLLIAILLLTVPSAFAGGKESGHGAAHLEQLEEFKKETDAMPPSEEKNGRLGFYYFSLGKVRLIEGRPEEALALFEKGDIYIPGRAGLAYYAGLAYFRLKRYHEAEAELFTATEEGDAKGEALKLLGRIYYERGELRPAAEAWERALGLKHDDHEAAELLAKVKREMAVEEKLDQAYTGKFILQYDGDRDETLGDQVLGILNDAFNDVGADLDYYPKEDITVILYTKKEFREVTGAPEWSGGLYDGKIRVPLGGVSPASARLKSLIYHEYAHAVVRSLAGGRCPRWLNEGIAVYEESRFVPFKAPPGESLPTAAELDSLFESKEDKEVLSAYGRSYAIVRKLADNFGIYRVGEWLHLLAEKKPLEEAFSTVFGIYNLTLEKLLKEG